MLITFDEALKLIDDGKVLHIAASEAILRKLPKGNWIGGSTEYFMAKEGGTVSDQLLFVTEFEYEDFVIKSYDENSISQVAVDAYSNGYAIVIVPFDSEVHKVYAQGAAGFDSMFLKDVVGWVAGTNLNVSEQTAISVNGFTGEIQHDEAAVLHIAIPYEDSVNIGIINIFEQDESSPLIEFEEEGFSVVECLVDGKKTNLADYIRENEIDTKLPLVGYYYGAGINISYKSISDDKTVDFYAPVFTGIQYRMAKNIDDYEAAFKSRLKEFKNAKALFSCNCILNFNYGELENKSIETFAGPTTFGEIAYQLVNQTLVYVSVF